VEDVYDIEDILVGEREVEAELVAELLDCCLGDRVGEREKVVGDIVSGHEVEKKKCDGDADEKRGTTVTEATQEIFPADHANTPLIFLMYSSQVIAIVLFFV
jgi:hypothetical protein